MTTIRPCLIDGCDRDSGVPGTARGYCRAHYNRWQKYGDPLGGSPSYMRTWKRASGTAEFVLQRIDTTAGPDGCWPWMGQVGDDGYAVWPGRGAAARALYEELVGPVPNGWTVDHLCHTRDLACPGGLACPHRLCVNVFRHIEPVTHGENMSRSAQRRALGGLRRKSPGV